MIKSKKEEVFSVKEENTITKILSNEIEFDGKIIKKIRFDLEHINRGWNGEKNDYNKIKRSHYNEDDILDFFEQFGFYTIEWDDGPEGNKTREIIRGAVYFRYVAYICDYENNDQKKNSN